MFLKDMKLLHDVTRLIVSACLVVPLTAALPADAPNKTKPNLILILADDLGFSDLGCYGSEIPTPNLDALAAGGLRFTQFYNTARCSPSRAALLTGLHPHQVGMGRLSLGAPATRLPLGYLGVLNQRCTTLAEVFRSAGYRTYMTGKWHLGVRDAQDRPLQRGFDRYYGILEGATSYLRPEGEKGIYLDNSPVPPPTNVGTGPNDYYTTDAFTDFAMKFIREHKGGAPFFLYLAFNAPHWPLQAKAEDIARFVGKYRVGWDKLRAQRHARQLELGIVSKEWPLSTRDDGVRTWESLTEQQQKDLDYRMAVYAAQVCRIDYNVGRLVALLREQGKLDTTLLVFLSDNGACHEPGSDEGGGMLRAINNPAHSNAISYGRGWANLSNTPLRRFKQFLHEGGIATPFIVHWPAGLKTKPGSLDATPGYLTDIMPTFIDVSGARYPSERNGQLLPPLEGCSLLPVFSGSYQPDTLRVFCWEQYGNKAVREGDWKAISAGDCPDFQWELYNVARDRTELHNVAAEFPDRVKDLEAKWKAWAARAQVAPYPPRNPRFSAKKETEEK